MAARCASVRGARALRRGRRRSARGGTEATVTDAQIVLGTLTARTIGRRARSMPRCRARGGGARLAAHARRAMPSARRARWCAAADAAMARALRRVSVERGVDPRRCALVAFGGGGPLHACALADHLGMRTVLVPPFAGVLSALGLAIAPERRDALASVMRRAHAIAARPHARGARTRGSTRARAGRREGGVAMRWLAREYLGQGHELEIPFAPGDEGASLASSASRRSTRSAWASRWSRRSR